MHFSDEDLAAALRRKDPGPEFTRRVISAIETKPESSLRGGRRKVSWWPLRFSPVLGGALATVLAVAGFLGIERYREYQAQTARAEKARQEAILALRITNTKLNHVFHRINQQEAPQPKPGRRTL